MPEPKRPLKVFLCHAHADRDPVRGLYTRLTKDGVDAWFDKAKLLPGQDWELEIRKAVREADVVVVCLSKQFNQAGFRLKEVKLALETAMEKPEGEIFIIPVRLEECENLESLRKWHWADLFEDDGYERLMSALRTQADKKGIEIKDNKVSKNKKTTLGASQIGIRLSVVLNLLGENLYSSDSVLVRENILNAIDAVRLRKAMANTGADEMKIDVRISPDYIEVEDWGIGMTADEIRQYFWNVGYSSKNTDEARDAEVIGQVGIGGFANFGRCSEVHIYTAKNNKTGLYSYVKKVDLEHGKGDYFVQSTNELNHQGTLMRFIPLVDSSGNKKKFDVNQIRDYLTRYIEFVPEKILINGVESSQRAFVKETRKRNGLTESNTRTANMLINAVIYEDEIGEVKLEPGEIRYGNNTYKVKGELRLKQKTSLVSIYKYGFFMDHYIDVGNSYLSGELDVPLVRLRASGEGFDSSSMALIKELLDGFTSLFAEYVAKNPNLVNGISGGILLEIVSKSGKLNLLDKFEVALADKTWLSLEYLKENYKTFTDGKVYYAKSGSELQASAFQTARHKVVLIGDLGYLAQINVEKYLVGFCNGESIPAVFVERIFEEIKLDRSTQYLVEVIRSHLKAKKCSQLDVVVCELKPLESMPFLLEEKELKLYCNILHPLIRKIIEYADKLDIDVMVDNIILEFIGSAIPRIVLRGTQS